MPTKRLACALAALALCAGPGFAQAQASASGLEFDGPSCRIERDASLDASITRYGAARIVHYLPKNIQAYESPAAYERMRVEREAEVLEAAKTLRSRMTDGADLCLYFLADLRCLPGDDDFLILADLLARFCPAVFDATDAALKEPTRLTDQQLRSWSAVRWEWFRR